MFAAAFGCAATLSFVLALVTLRSMSFGFAIAPEAARTLAFRILLIRGLGFAFALSLMLLVVFAGSRAARAALVARYVLGLVTSVAFLRGIGVVAPSGDHATLLVLASAFQLVVEGFAILMLYGEDAAEWFTPRTRF